MADFRPVVAELPTGRVVDYIWVKHWKKLDFPIKDETNSNTRVENNTFHTITDFDYSVIKEKGNDRTSTR